MTVFAAEVTGGSIRENSRRSGMVNSIVRQAPYS
jgi:hypothetical protein